ncbi:hypothetical protein EAS62_07390 [Bradyrhizobium zhanjiangense]|uniref:Uncharacterized protein n=1 Tax=Bradyrhizobium zhanjiangense TaxID=1325107 RepID=A0ABY0DPL8_9BRAD|nr:hypothetical protein EAS62_07390 [Bradyrhizobium zhanjiangense]
MYDAALASSPGEGRMYFGDGCIQRVRYVIAATPSAYTPSLRAQRSNPDCLRGETLDCFDARAPRNDGGESFRSKPVTTRS